jgi:hypothetical protein
VGQEEGEAQIDSKPEWMIGFNQLRRVEKAIRKDGERYVGR